MISKKIPLLLTLCSLLGPVNAQEGQDLYRILGTQPGGNMGQFVGGGEFSVIPDGLPDLVAVENGRILISEFPGLNSWLEILSITTPTRLSIMDIDLDGQPDLCLPESSSGISTFYTSIIHGPIGNRTITTVVFGSGYLPRYSHFLGNVTGSAHPEVFFVNNSSCTFWDFDPIAPGFTAWSHTGQDAVNLGDATGDGYEEFALLAADSVQLWHGGTPLPLFAAWQVDPMLQGTLTSIAAMSDLNGDGWNEIVVGRDAYASGSGGIVIMSGLDGAILARYDGQPGQFLGQYDHVCAGDLDGDGEDEILIGAPRADPGAKADAGAVIVLDYNGSSNLVLMRQIAGNDAGDQFGSSITVLGDVDGNGKLNFAAGAPGDDPFGFSNAGAIYTFEGSGTDTPLLTGPVTAGPGQTIMLHMRGGTPGDYNLWLASTNSAGSYLFGEPLGIGAPQYLLKISRVALIGVDSLQISLPMNLPSNLYFENLLVLPGGGAFGPKETSNTHHLLIQ
jgi:FG-GAP repeat protein